MKHNEDINNIRSLITRYFDAATSEDDERRLRQILASTSLSDPMIDEARAMMGLFAVARRQKPRRKFSPLALRAAASVAVILMLGLVVALSIRKPMTDDNQCMAKIDGVVITDRIEVMRVVNRDLQAINDIRNELRSEISSQLQDIQLIRTASN